MSGDGIDDVTIPTVFLFTQDASKLLLALSKDPTIKVTLREYKLDSEILPQNEEQSMFHKLKASVQEFFNKHTGIEFKKTVEVGGFKGYIGADKIRITHTKTEEKEIPSEKSMNQLWKTQTRKELLNSILRSSTKEVFVPLSILRIYYQMLSGDPVEEINKYDVGKMTLWLLNELNVEYHKKEDDFLIKVEGVAMEVNEQSPEVLDTRRKLEKLNSILETINQIEKNVIDDLSKISKDDLFVSEKRSDSGKVILTKEQLEASESEGDEKQQKNGAKDEL